MKKTFTLLATFCLMTLSFTNIMALPVDSMMVEQPMYADKAINNEECVPDFVSVLSAPTSVTITGNNLLCLCDNTVLTAHSDVPGIFIWNDGTVGPNLTVAAGVYNVTIITDDGYQMTSENFTVESFGSDLIVSATATSICQGEHTTLSVDQNGWQGNVTYQWDAQAGNSTATTVDVQPAVTTTYHVTATVTSESGSCTAESEVTIIVHPLPVVAAVTATDTVVCEGTQVTFTATGDANTTAYIWYNNGVEIAGENQAALTVNFNEAGVYNYAVKAISNEGCVSAIAMNAPVVTVNAVPESVTISGNMSICNGGVTTLYANVVPNDAASYVWYMDNNPILDETTDNFVVTAAGSYKVVAIVNGCSTESNAVVVMVEQAPQLQLTAEETLFCAGGSTVITAEATGWNNDDVIYSWSNNYQGSAYTINAAVAGTYTFHVTASQATSGCVAVGSITINVNELPTTPQVTLDNAVICDGGQVTLTVTNAVNNAVYTWYRNGVIIPNATTSVLTESPVTVDGDATNYVYTVVATLPMSGCTSLVSANTIVTVIPTPVVSVSIEGNTTLCAGGSTILHANVSPANANYSYQWYKDNAPIPGAITAYHVAAEVARENVYNYSVVVSANAGCNVTAYAPAITFVADPVVEATISNNISCVGGTATLTATVNGGVADVNGLNGYSFEWYHNVDPTNPVSNMLSFTTSGNEAIGSHSYWVMVTSNYGCQSTSAPVAYSVIADPVVTIAVANGYPTTVCAGGSTAIKAYVTGGYGEIAYQWYKNGNLLVGETNQTLALNNLTGGANDTYTVEVTQTGVGCANNASVALNAVVTVAPTYTVDIAGFGNVCEGGTLTLNATVNNVLVGDVLSYQWYRIYNGGEAVAINGANAAQYSTSELLLGNSYDYYVVVTSQISGCSVVSNSVPANVVPVPTVAIQGANTVCEGGNLTLNAFVNGGVDGDAYTYVWNWTGAANGSDTTAVATYNVNLGHCDAAAPYYFTVTIFRNDLTGCTATSAAHEVNVLSAPTVTVTADNNYVCQSGDVTFTAHVSPVGAYNYVWTINGQQQAVNASTITTSIANVGTITAGVVVSAANASASCSATATIATPVQVVAAPTVTISADHTTMCVGGTTTLTSNISVSNNIPGEFNYQWVVNGIEVSGAVASSIAQILNVAGNHVYTLRIFQDNNLGCNSTWSAPVTVQVAEQPVVTLTSTDGLSICEGGTITLTGIVTNYNNTVNGVSNNTIYGAMTFDWTSNGVNVHHNTNVTTNLNQIVHVLNTVGNYSYQVTVDAAGYNCQPQASNVEVVNVVGDPSWTEVHVYGSNGVNECLGDIVILEAEIQGGVADYSGSTSGHIQWIVTDGTNTMNALGGLGGSSYDIPAAAGTYTYIPTFVGNIGNGCHLTNTAAVQTDITVHEPLATVFNVIACDSYTWNDFTYTQSGIYTYDYIDINGCSSTDTLTLTVNSSSYYILADTVLENDLPYTCNGQEYFESGTYYQTLTNAAGCDSLLTVNLTVLNNVWVSLDTTVCDSYVWNGINYPQSGNYTQLFSTVYGTDSTVTVHLTINYSDTLNLYVTACDSHEWDGVTYTTSGDYTQTFTAANGCDSVVTLHLSVNHSYTCDTTAVACDSFDWYEHTNLTQSGEYTHTFTNAAGCDSVVTLHLTILHGSHNVLTEIVCDSYEWHGITYTQSGIYMYDYVNSNGCPSTDTLTLTVNSSSYHILADTVLENDLPYTCNGQEYFESGTYYQTLTNAAGCDSLLTVNLSVLYNVWESFDAAACNYYEWNGITYTQSGEYEQQFITVYGSDSTVTLHLTINHADTTNLYATACDSYDWNGVTYTESGNHSVYLTNAIGCDSLVTLHLTINYSDTANFYATACNSYNWNGETYTESGDYSFLMTNATGCDLVAILHLTVNETESSEFTVISSDSCYTWNDMTYCQTGDYIQTFQAATGCDSIVTLHLTITVGINNVDGFDFKVYPNPTNDYINVQCTMYNVQMEGIEVIDVYGKVVHNVVWTNNDSSVPTRINVSGLASGMYFVRVTTSEGAMTKMFVKK